MKIVFVIDSWHDGNGAIVSTKRTVKELLKRGYEITVVSTGKHECEHEFVEIPGFYLAPVKESMENMGFLFGKGKKSILQKAFQGADLVQIQFPFFLARKAVKIAKKMNIPVIGACHIQPQNIISAMGKEDAFMEKMFYKLFNFCLFKQVGHIHCPSEFASKMLKDQGSKATMEVISNGIPNEYQVKNLEKPKWFEDKFVIMNVGRHAMEKRQELLIDGVLRSKYKDKIQLLLCGKGEDTLKLRKRGEELPVKPFIEYVSLEDKIHYLNCADLYLHSSVVELESLSCLEAIGCGLPCLIGDSPHSAASQFALDDRFLFEMDNPDDIGRKIDVIIENRENMKEIREATLKMAERYRFDRCTDSMEACYEKITGLKVKDRVLVGV